jgi:hypothetical protein
MAEVLRTRIPGARYALLHGFGSLVLLEAPEAFLAVAERFLDDALKRS